MQTLLSAAFLVVTGVALHAGALVNPSFERPSTDFIDTRIDGWTETPKPAWYDETQFTWDQVTGVFVNPPEGQPTRISNMEGNQAAYLFAVPTVGIFQVSPTVRFEVGHAYEITAGFTAGKGGMKEGASLLFGVYYPGPNGEQNFVATENVIYTAAAFPSGTTFVEMAVHVPAVKAGDAWAGQRLGVAIICSIQNQDLVGGYFDVDAVQVNSMTDIPNFSFELPHTDFVDTNVVSWTKAPKPDWWQDSTFPWGQGIGVFVNPPAGMQGHKEEMDQRQGLYMFAVPQNGLWQLLPARYEAGRSYTGTVGLSAGGGNMVAGVTLQAILYYLNDQGQRVPVGAREVAFTTAQFSNPADIVDIEFSTPMLGAGHPAVGKQIGIEFLSTVAPDKAGGYWDFDNVRLEQTPLRPNLSIARAGQGVELRVSGEPGQQVEILTTASLGSAGTIWTSLGTFTNETGALTIPDTLGSTQKFYLVSVVE